MTDQAWFRAASLEDVRQRGRVLFRHDGRQIAIFDTGKGILACNNRCPHEGFPLHEGTLDGQCLLTCNWHNWKFDLTTGENQRGGDKLRVYPVRVRGTDVWIRIVDPPVEDQLAKSLADLRQGFERHDYERLARELARILRLGIDPLLAVKEAIHAAAQAFVIVGAEGRIELERGRDHVAVAPAAQGLHQLVEEALPVARLIPEVVGDTEGDLSVHLRCSRFLWRLACKV